MQNRLVRSRGTTRYFVTCALGIGATENPKLSLLYVLIVWFYRRRFAVNHDYSTFCVHQRIARSVVRFLWSEGVSGAAIHQRLSAQCGNSVLPQRSVYEWIEKLKDGCTNVTHGKGAGLPSTAITRDNIERARGMVLLDRRLSIDEVAHVLQISHGLSYETMHNKLVS